MNFSDIYYTPFGNSCVHLLCQAFNGFWAISGSRCVLRPGRVLEYMFLIIVSFTCVFVGLEFTYCVNSIGNWIVLGFALFAIWRFMVVWKWCERLVASFFLVLGYRRGIAGNTWVRFEWSRVVHPMDARCLDLSCPAAAAAVAAAAAWPLDVKSPTISHLCSLDLNYCCGDLCFRQTVHWLPDGV